MQNAARLWFGTVAMDVCSAIRKNGASQNSVGYTRMRCVAKCVGRRDAGWERGGDNDHPQTSSGRPDVKKMGREEDERESSEEERC